MYVCMSVRNGFTIEIYGFMHSLRTFGHVQLRMPSQFEDSEDRRRRQNESNVWKMVNCSTKG